MQVGNHPFITDVRENIEVNAPNGDQYTQDGFSLKCQFKRHITRTHHLILISMQ